MKINGAIALAVIFITVVAIIGTGADQWQRLFILLLLLAAGVKLLFTGKIHGFWPNLLALILGPLILCLLFSLLKLQCQAMFP
jgi:hypothetical protein